MRFHRILFTALAVVALGSFGASARAQCGALGFGYGGLYDIGNLYRVLANNVPYYAAFPPVYYSYPVPRTYGHSPFAYLPTHETPDMEMCAPLAINNPYFKSTAEAGEEAPEITDQLTTAPAEPEPLVIVNPFVRPSGTEGPVVRTAVFQQ